jgi:hypothetical protein
VIGLGLAALAGSLALSGCGSASGAPGIPSYAGTLCPAQPSGEPCVKVLDRGHVVDDVIGYLSASDSPLAGKTWRLVLSRYSCDPASAARPKCSPAAIYPGPTRHGLPPARTSCRTQSGETVTTPNGCHNALAQQMGSFGDWSGFALPTRFPSRTWLCVSEQIRVGGSWRQPDGALATQPVRACAAVSPS